MQSRNEYLNLHTGSPNPPSATDTQPVAPSGGQEALRRPTYIVDLVITLPASHSALSIALSACGLSLGAISGCGCGTDEVGRLTGALVEQVPDHDQAIVASGCKCASSGRGPFDAIYCSGMASQLEQSLPWLSNVKDANTV